MSEEIGQCSGFLIGYSLDSTMGFIVNTTSAVSNTASEALREDAIAITTGLDLYTLIFAFHPLGTFHSTFFLFLLLLLTSLFVFADLRTWMFSAAALATISLIVNLSKSLTRKGINDVPKTALALVILLYFTLLLTMYVPSASHFF